MSTTIENQVVSMQFDNKHFESNVQTSLSTLDKLKKSLKFPGAAKGFDDISASAKKVNLSPLGTAVDKVGLKFNGMYTIADQVLRNITNRVQQTAENIVKSFTIDPIKTGFQEYETQIGAVQTILANTQSKGSTLDDVNGALDELNSYADKTIYNFTEMTRNIGTFTAAGVDLDKSVQSIKGIANLAAISGSTSQQASTAMYQLSQALAAGKVQLMDWNSVVNAGMGGEVFQTALKRTAKQMGYNVDEMIKKYGSFRESLTKGEWLTAEVLTETLAQLSGAYTEADLIGQGYSESQAKEILKLAQTAESAATDVKTFTQLMDTLKESAQSGWTQTWELLVGDFNEAKELWSGISNAVGGFIGKSADQRNTVLRGALTSNWDKLIDKINKAGVETVDFEEATKKALKEHGYDVDKLIAKHGSLEEVFRSGAASSDVLKTALDKLNKSGEDLANIDFSTITRTLKNGFKGEDVKKIEQALTDLGYSLTGKDGKFYGGDGFFGTVTRDAIKEFQKEHKLKVTGEVDEETLAMLEKLHKEAVETEKAFDGLDESVVELIDGIEELGGREKILAALEDIFYGIKNIVSPLGKAFGDVFGPITSEKLVGMIDGFKDSAHQFFLWTQSIPGSKFIRDITNAFKGFLSVVKLIGTVIGGLVKGAFTVFGKIFNTVGLDIARLIGNMGKGVTKFQEWITSSGNLTKAFDVISNAITGTIEKVRDWVKAFFDLPVVQKNLEKFKTEFSGVVDIVKSRFGDAIQRFKDFVDRIKEMDGFTLDNIKKAFLDFFNNVLGPIWKNEDGTTIFDGLISTIRNLWSNAQKYCGKIGTAFKNFGNALSTFFSSVKEWAGNNAGGLFALGSLLSIFLIFKKIADAIKVIAEPLAQFGDVAEALEKGIKRISKAVSFNLKAEGVKDIATAIAILVGSVIGLTLVDQTKLTGALIALATIIVGLGALIATLGTYGKDLKDLKGIGTLAGSIIALSGALLIFALAAKIIAGVETGDLLKAGAIVGGFIGVAYAITKFTGTGSAVAMAGFGKMMAKLSIALLLMSVAVGILGKMDNGTLLKGGAAIAVFLGMMVGMMAATKLLAKDIPKFASMMIGLSVALLLMSVSVGILGNMDTETLIQGGIAIAAFLGMMVGMMAATKLLDKDMPKFGSTMLGLSTGLLAMALTVKIIAGIDTGDLIKGGIVIAAFLGMMVGMMAATKLLGEYSSNAGKIGLMMLSFAASMILLTGAIAVLAMLDGNDIAKAVIAIGGVGLIFAGMVALTKFANASAGVKTTILAMAAAVAVLAISIAALSFVDTSKLLGASAALGIVIGMFALLVASSKFISMKAVASIAIMTLLVAGIAGVLYLLSNNVNPDEALKVTAALSILIITLSASCLLLGALAPLAAGALTGVLAMGVLIAELALVLAAIGALAQIPGLTWIIDEGAELLKSIGGAIGGFVGSIIGGIAEGITASLPQIGTDLSTFMTNLEPFLEGVKSIDATAIEGAKAIADIILTLTAASILEGLTAWLTGGSSLGDFAAQLLPFGQGIKAFADSVVGIDTESMTTAINAAKTLCDVASTIPTTGGLVDVIFGTNDLSTFGSQLKNFGSGIKSFADSVAGIDSAAVTTGVNAGKSLADVASAIPATGGWIDKFLGTSDLSTFGSQLKNFGSGIKSFADSVAGIDSAAVTTGVNAGKSLADVASTIPATGGWLDKFLGTTDLSTFGSQLKNFGSGIKSFADSVAGIDSAAVTTGINAGKSLADVASTIPNTGGIIDWFTGTNDLSTFGSQLKNFGSGIKGFADEVAGIDTASVTAATNAATALSSMANTIPDSGGLFSWFTGDNDLSTFGSQLKNFGTGLKGFADEVAGIDSTSVTTATTAATSLSSMAAGLPSAESIDKVKWLGEKLKNFGTGLKDFASEVAGIDSTSVTTATNAAVSLSNMAANLPDATSIDKVKWLGEKLKNFGTGIKDFATEVAGVNAAKLLLVTIQISSLASTLSTMPSDFSGANSFKAALEDLSTVSINNLVEAFTGAKTKVMAAVKSMMAGAIVGIASHKAAFTMAAMSVVGGAVSALTLFRPSFVSAGLSLAQGFASGISAGTFTAAAAASAMASAALAAAKSKLKINSPSKVFIPVGEAVPEGFAMGVDRLGGMVKRSTESMADNAIDGAKNAISRLVDVVNMDIDTQPTIRPVLDLSDVESGIGGMNGMFGMQPSIGVMSNLRSINSMMGDRQNGGNSDVISAIKDLGSKFGNNSGDTYNVNGITYDDGSNVTNAVKALIRGVKVERRI